MRESTAYWLNPMLEALLLDEDPETFLEVMQQASMPMCEAEDSPLRSFVMQHEAIPDTVPMAVDWIRFGQLLRARLGWEDRYPAWPEHDEEQDTP